MSDRRICYILPSFSHFNYVWACVDSYFNYASPSDVCLLVDDASPDWDQRDVSARTAGNNRLLVMRFEKNGGLTRSWNAALEAAKELGFTYIVCGNSDVLFSRDWEKPLLHWLDRGYSLVGPVSNAPGVTAADRQQVDQYLSDFSLSDSPAEIDKVATLLARDHFHTIAAGPLNGFFMMAKTAEWFKGAFDRRHVFRPVNERAPSGRFNPTPLMTCNEDELQSRWSKLAMRSCICAGSYIFHYRAVSRGDQHRRGHWMRRAG